MSALLTKTKMYLLEVVLKKMGPAALASVVSAAFAFLAAHQGLLEAWGITFGTWPLQWASGQTPSGQVILIEMDTLSKVGLAALVTAVGVIGAAGAHHGSEAIDSVTGASAETK